MSAAPNEVLADWRKAQGLTQARVADLAGIAQSYYAELETGRKRSIGPDVAKKLRRLMGDEAYMQLAQAALDAQGWEIEVGGVRT